jgi:hypothetical protein
MLFMTKTMKESDVKSVKWILPLILVAAMATGQQLVPVQPATLVVKTIGGHTLTLAAQDLAKMQSKLNAKDHDGKKGAALLDFLILCE